MKKTLLRSMIILTPLLQAGEFTPSPPVKENTHQGVSLGSENLFDIPISKIPSCSTGKQLTHFYSKKVNNVPIEDDTGKVIVVEEGREKGFSLCMGGDKKIKISIKEHYLFNKKK